jgi:hypothetical protein
MESVKASAWPKVGKSGRILGIETGLEIKLVGDVSKDIESYEFKMVTLVNVIGCSARA